MASNECWGIEVGSGAIKALRLAGSGESIEVLDLALIPHKKVLSTPDLDLADAMRVALGTLTSQFDVSGNVAVSVPGHAAFARFAKLPPVDPKKVPAIVKFEAAQQIPFPIEDVEWDYQTFVSPDSPDVEVGIFAITRERILQQLSQLQEVGIIPDIVTLSPIAAYNALAYDLGFDEETPGTIMVDVGTQSTDLLISEPGRVWVRTFPIGGHHFTEALVEKFKLSYAKAERLKKEAEQSQHARHVFQAMRPVFADLAQDIQRSIGYYQSLHTDAKLVRLIGLGSTFQIPGLRKYLKQQLQMHVYRLESFKRLSVEGPRAAELAAHAGNFATAYGLALQGLGRASLPANLMPAPVVRETMWRRKVKWFGIAAGISIATGAAMFIRPFLDSQAVAGAPMPVSVTNTIQDVQRAAGEAKEVTNAAPANYDAANLIALAKDRGIYASIVNDVGLMLEDSQKVLDEWPTDGLAPGTSLPKRAYVVKSLSTSYRGPVGKEKTPVVDVTLTVETMHPDATRFMVQSLDRWLVDHETREGVGYTILPGGPPAWVLTGEQVVGGGPASAVVAGNQGLGRDRGGRSGRGGRSIDPFMDAPLPPGTIQTGVPTTPQYQQPGRAQSSAELDRLAPLTAPEETKAPGTKVSTFDVLWSVVVQPESDGGKS